MLHCVFGSVGRVSDLRWCSSLPDGYPGATTAEMESTAYALKTGEWERAVTASGCKVFTYLHSNAHAFFLCTASNNKSILNLAVSCGLMSVLTVEYRIFELSSLLRLPETFCKQPIKSLQSKSKKYLLAALYT